MGISTVYAADQDATKAVDWDAIKTVSTIVYDTLREMETEQGKPIQSVAELKEVINSPQYQDSYFSALISFCEQPEHESHKYCVDMKDGQ